MLERLTEHLDDFGLFGGPREFHHEFGAGPDAPAAGRRRPPTRSALHGFVQPVGTAAYGPARAARGQGRGVRAGG